MMRRAVWFERKFDPVATELLPNILVRLRGTPARLEDALRGRSPELLVRTAGGKWSAQEHAGHLLDMEPLWLARVDDFVTGKDQLTVADLTNRKTHEARHNDAPLDRILSDFRLARQALLGRIRELGDAPPSRGIVHPRLGTAMKLQDHLYFVAEHDDHHLAAIWELIEEPS